MLSRVLEKLSTGPPSWTPPLTRLLSSVPELVHPQSMVLSSSACSLGFECKTKEGHRPQSVRGCFGSLLTLPGELVDAHQIPLNTFLRKVKSASDVFGVPPLYHIRPAPLSPCSPCSSQIRFCSRGCIYTYPASLLQKSISFN